MKSIRAIVTTGFYLVSDARDDIDNIELQQLIIKAKLLIRTLSVGELELIPTECYAASWVEDSINLDVCSRCKAITSDPELPQYVASVAVGKVAGDATYMCVECLELNLESTVHNPNEPTTE